MPTNTPVSQPINTNNLGETLSPKGRFNRTSFFAWYGIVSIASSIFPMMFESIFPSISLPIVLCSIVISTAFAIVFSIRRLHDLNKSGHFLWLYVLSLCFFIAGLYQLAGLKSITDLLLAIPILIISLILQGSLQDLLTPFILLSLVINIALTGYICFTPGDQHPNKFGAPRSTPKWETFAAWLYILLVAISIISISIFILDPLA